MKPVFNTLPERNDILFLRSYRNDYGIPRFHSPIEIYFVDEGEMETLVAGKARTLQGGSVAVTLSYEVHAYRTPVASRSGVIMIPPHMCPEFMAAVKGKRLADPYITDPAVYRELKLYFEKMQEPGADRVKLLGYVYVVLGIVLEHTTLTEGRPPTDNALGDRLLYYISENFRSDISPASIAHHFGYSQSYISRFFHAQFGIKLCSYITSVRLREALVLLQEGKRDITNCALESGFSSMRTFYRAFAAEFGCSPKAYFKHIQE